jgi:hypothetical protein
MKFAKTKLYFWLTLTLFSLTINSCTKEDTRPDCEINKYGTITVSNNSTNPYNIYVDDVFKTQLQGKSISTKIKVNSGNNRKFYAKQVSGFLLFPTEVTTYTNVVSCSDYTWQIP